MQRKKSQIIVELPNRPLSKHDDNKASAPACNNQKTPKARASINVLSVEIPVKVTPLSKSKVRVEDQNTEPNSDAVDHALKRKRSQSDVVGGGAANSKKTREPERAKSVNKPSMQVQPTKDVVSPPQPKWTPIPTDISYDEIMQRMQLREFLARFQPLTKLAQVHLDILSRFSVPIGRYIPRATLKHVLLALVDLVGADATANLRQGCQTALKHIRNAKGDLAITWDVLAELRKAGYSGIPNPDQPPSTDLDLGETDDDEEDGGRVTRRTSRMARLSQPAPPPKDNSLDFPLQCGGQFLPILVFLAEFSLQTPSIRGDIDAGQRTLATAAHKSYTAKSTEERTRWLNQRQKFSSMLVALEATRAQEKSAIIAKGGKIRRGSPTNAKIKDIKSKRKAAETEHQRTNRKISVAYNLELRACASRGTYLGSDRLGRQYFALLLAPKTIRSENRWEYWSTFVFCWGMKTDGMQPCWYGFGEPSELRTLVGMLKHDAEHGLTPSNDLIKSLVNYTEFIEDRLKE